MFIWFGMLTGCLCCNDSPAFGGGGNMLAAVWYVCWLGGIGTAPGCGGGGAFCAEEG